VDLSNCAALSYKLDGGEHVSFALGQRATDVHLLALLLKPGRTSQRPSSPSPGSTPPAVTAPATRWAPVEEGKHAQHSRNAAGVLEHLPGRSANEMPTCYLYVGLVGKQNRDRRARPSAGGCRATPKAQETVRAGLPCYQWRSVKRIQEGANSVQLFSYVQISITC